MKRRFSVWVACNDRPLSPVYPANAVEHAFTVAGRAGAVPSIPRDRRRLVTPGGDIARYSQIEIEIIRSPRILESTDRLGDSAAKHCRGRRDDVPVEPEQGLVEVGLQRRRRHRPGYRRA